MTQSTPPAEFMTDLKQHWPFPAALNDCTLVSACFAAQALTPQLFTLHELTAPQATHKRQAEFLAARLCARHALAQLTGTAHFPRQQENSRIPVWPQGTCGSMSHSHSLAAAIVGSSHTWLGMGLDIEKVISSERAQRLAPSILTPEEYQRCAQFTAAQLALHLTQVFSLKESLFKALNPLTGTYFGFQDAQVLDPPSTASGQTRLQLRKDLSKEWPQGSSLPAQFTTLHGSVLSLVSIAR